MGRNETERRNGTASGPDGASAASPSTVKVTLHLTVGTAQRLGVESAMRRISQSAIAEEVLAGYLSRWQLPRWRKRIGSKRADDLDAPLLADFGVLETLRCRSLESDGLCQSAE